MDQQLAMSAAPKSENNAVVAHMRGEQQPLDLFAEGKYQ